MIHITKTFNPFQGRIPNGVDNDTKKFLQGLIEHNKTLAEQLNGMKQEIQVGSFGDTTVNINTGLSGASGGGSAQSITVSTQALTAGVATTIVFSSPALLLGLPDCYATDDGIFTLIGYSFTSAEPISFTITAIADCQVKYAYQLL